MVNLKTRIDDRRISERRDAILDRLIAGHRVDEIAADFRLTPSTIYQYRSRYWDYIQERRALTGVPA